MQIVKSGSIIISILLALFIQETYQVISGSISMESAKTKIQLTSVKYTFALSCSESFQKNGKLIIIFPDDFTFTSTQTLTCSDTSTGTSYTCSLQSSARLLTLFLGSSFTTTNSMSFQVSGITNPSYAVETGSFTIRSYKQDTTSSSSHTFIEPSADTLKVTPTAGSLSSRSTTTLTISVSTEHSIPSDGQISITFPKWNSFATTSSSIQPYISASTSPGYVTCTPISGFTATKLTCLFTEGTSSDTLVITQSTGAAIVAASTSLSFSINNVKTPPSMKTVTGFTIYTQSSDSETIDSSTDISYAATTVASLPASYVTISAANAKINTYTTLTIQIKTMNPMAASSKLKIVIPSEFGVTKLTSVTGSGGSINTSPTFSLSSSNSQIDITSFNSAYLSPSSYVYIYLSSVRTPVSTKDTSSFTITFSDSDGNLIESQSAQITFNASPGGFTSYSITPSSSYVNKESVQYQFNFKPDDSFTTSVILKITFPDQVYVTDRTAKSLYSYNSYISSSAKLTVTSNKYAVILNAFKSDYSSTTGGTVQLTIDGITNPESVEKTDSFEISVYYEEDVDVVDELTSGLTVTMSASPELTFSVNMLQMVTGFNNQLQFIVNTGTKKVTKGSYLLITIPPSFKVYNFSISAGTCIKIEGFSDEVTCQYLSTNSYTGHVLKVSNGFDSNDFSGGVFSFNISEIRNPFTSEETSSFKLYIYDSSGNSQYYYPYSLTFMIKPQAFQYALVTSDSPVNGMSSLYTFTLTFSVDTESHGVISINPPSEISFDTSKSLTCTGLVNLSPTLKCSNKNNKQFLVTIQPSNLKTQSITNGTSISFSLGYFINPKSFDESSSFIIQTFITSDSNTNYYYINKENQGLTIQNTQKGNITKLAITQVGSTELGAQTSLRISFTSQNSIPSGSYVVMTIPSTISTGSSFSGFINGKSASISYTSSSRQVKIQTQNSDQTDFIITISSGLYNPSTGPYSYSDFILDIQTSKGYSIDQTTSTTAFVTTNCTSNCSTCSGKLATCTSCTYNSTLSKSFYLIDNKCSEVCVSGYYADDSDFKCKKCEYPCQQCKYGSTLCTKCYSNYSLPYAYPATLQCYKECPSGTYLDRDQGLCVACQSPCFTCSSQQNCLSCSKSSSNMFINYYSQDQKCYQSCPNGTVQTSSSQCVDCQSPCKTCSEATDQCVTCLDGYYLHHSTVCLSSCPKNYLPDIATMTCVYQGEMAFPAPFCITVALITLGLLMARFMKNQTRFWVTILAFTDMVLKINWVFLFFYLFIGHYYVSAGIITYCLFATLITNIIIWKFTFNRKLANDPYYQVHAAKYPISSKIIQILSFTVSFHIFRLQYSRFFGKKAFSATFKNQQTLFKITGRLSIFAIIFIYLPAVVANSYNLYYVRVGEQTFYFDIDGLVLVIYECILIGIVMSQRERMAGFSLKEMVEDVVKTDVKDEGLFNEQQVKDMMSKLDRRDIIRKHFNDNDLREGESDIQIQEEPEVYDVTQAYTHKIFGNLMKHFQSDTSNRTNSVHQTKHNPYYSNGVGFLDIKEYQELKKAHKQMQIKVYNQRNQLDKYNSQRNEREAQLKRLLDENGYLISEEDRLRQEIEEIKANLVEFNDITQQELVETEAMRRDQIKHKIKMSKLKQFITNAVLNKGKELLDQRKQQEIDAQVAAEQERVRRQQSVHAQTLSSMQRSTRFEKQQNTAQTSSPKKKRRDNTYSPHLAKPPMLKSKKQGGKKRKQSPEIIDAGISEYQQNDEEIINQELERVLSQDERQIQTAGIQSTNLSPQKVNRAYTQMMGARSADKRDRSQTLYQPGHYNNFLEGENWMVVQKAQKESQIEENKDNDDESRDLL